MLLPTQSTASPSREPSKLHTQNNIPNVVGDAIAEQSLQQNDTERGIKATPVVSDESAMSRASRPRTPIIEGKPATGDLANRLAAVERELAKKTQQASELLAEGEALSKQVLHYRT